MKRRSFFGLLLASVVLPLLKLVEWAKPKRSAWEKIVDSYEADRRGCVRNGYTTDNGDLYFMGRDGLYRLAGQEGVVPELISVDGDTSWTST